MKYCEVCGSTKDDDGFCYGAGFNMDSPCYTSTLAISSINSCTLGREAIARLSQGTRVPVVNGGEQIAMVVPIQQYKAMLRLEQERVHSIAKRVREEEAHLSALKSIQTSFPIELGIEYDREVTGKPDL